MEPSSLSLPDNIGDYRIGECLGQGGMGEVYEAWDTTLERSVAIKLIRADLTADTHAQERFRREAKAIARLDHPSIVRIHHIQKWEGHHCIVMERVEGESLASLVQKGPLPVGHAALLVHQIAEGLAAAHAQDIIHRDLKTTNVMVTSNGGVKILDFGLAKRLSGDTVSAPGAVVGTLHTMSPEQAQGQTVDTRTDLFSLGALAYELLTGTAPFRGGNATETYARVIGHRPPPVHELRPEVPEQLSKLVDQLLEKDPGQRPRDARAVADALSLWMDTAPTLSPTLVRRDPSTGDTVADDALAQTPTVTTDADATGPAPSTPTRSVLRSAVLLLPVLAGLVYFLGPWAKVDTPATVLVLGFASEDGSVGSGMPTLFSEMLTDELRSHRDIRVLSGEQAYQIRRDYELTGTATQQELANVAQAIPHQLVDAIVVGAWSKTNSGFSVEVILRKARWNFWGPKRVTGRGLSPLSAVQSLVPELLVEGLGIRAPDPTEIGSFTSSLPEDLETLLHYAEALAAWRDADFETANTAFARAVELDPFNAQIRITEALYWVRRGYQEKAEKAADLAKTQVRDSDLDAHLQILAKAHEVLDEKNLAAQVYAKLLGRHPDEILFGVLLAKNQEAGGIQTLENLRFNTDSSFMPLIDLAEAQLYSQANDHTRALELIETAIVGAAGHHQIYLQAEAGYWKALILSGDERYEEALASLEESQKLFDRVGDFKAKLDNVFAKASIATLQGDFEEARQMFELYKIQCETQGDYINAAQGAINLGAVLHRLDKFENAIEYLREAIKISELQETPDTYIAAHVNLSAAMQSFGDLDGAYSVNEWLLENLEGIQYQGYRALVSGNQGEVLLWQGKIEESRRYLERARNIEKLQFNYENPFTLRVIGESAAIQSQIADAADYLSRSLQAASLPKDIAETKMSQAVFELLARDDALTAYDVASEAAETFGRDLPSGLVRAMTVAARSLIRKPDPDFSKAADLRMDIAFKLGKSQDFRVRFGISLLDAELAGHRDKNLGRVRSTLRPAIEESEEAGHRLNAWEAELLLGELEMNLGAEAEGRQRLEKVRKEAKEQGWTLFERRANNLLDR